VCGDILNEYQNWWKRNSCVIGGEGQQALQTSDDVDLAGILGSVMAHEIGHMLLGSHAHAISGIMRGHWERDDLLSIRAAEMQFTKEQSQRIKRKVMSFNNDPDSH